MGWLNRMFMSPSEAAVDAAGQHDRAGRYAQAAEAWTEVLRLTNPGNSGMMATWLGTRAKAYSNAGNYDRAIADYTEELKHRSPTDKNTYLTYSNLGECHFKKGDHESAVAELTRAIDAETELIAAKRHDYPNLTEPSWYSVRLRGEAYLKMGRYDEAVADFDRVLRQWDADPRPVPLDWSKPVSEATVIITTTYNLRGMAHTASGRYDRATADLDRLILNLPGYATFHHNRGAARLGRNDLAGALADFDEAIRLDPGNGRLNLGRAVARRAAGDERGAAEDDAAAQSRGARPPTAGPGAGAGIEWDTVRDAAVGTAIFAGGTLATVAVVQLLIPVAVVAATVGVALLTQDPNCNKCGSRKNPGYPVCPQCGRS